LFNTKVALIRKKLIVENLIEKEFYSLKSSMSFKEAIKIFKKSGQNDLPIVDDTIFQGVIFFDQLKGREDNKEAISIINKQFRSISVFEDERMIVTLKKMTNEGISSLPVVDSDGTMMGVILASRLWSEFAVKSSLVGPGGWVVLSMKNIDYKFSEIAHIAELNGMKIIFHFVNYLQGMDLIDVHIKVDRENVNELVQTFQRYEYKVSDVIQQKKFSDNWDDRFDELMRYFSI